ncbi:MAG: helix-turn-helix transcriptional regulator [Rhodobiaceae bacterium]|nr:helix-turn-helix transcriptional regulator [Rhodobiaceae bacterium]
MDKRELISTFQERLAALLREVPGSRAQFAQSIGIDRSALSQIMAPDSARLPRADTLCRIAETHGVTLDWLLGLSQTQTAEPTQIAPTLEIEEVRADGPETTLARWHREALGTKIRYVPSYIPDFLRTRTVIAHESNRASGPDPATKIHDAEGRIDYNRRPETDMEACMPIQTLEALAGGTGLWSGLSAEDRRRQLQHMASLIHDLYPTFRLFLFDLRTVFSAPFTVFGQQRAAIYMGDMYLVLTGTDHIRTLIRHFDGLIRKAVINPHEVADYVDRLATLLDDDQA